VCIDCILIEVDMPIMDGYGFLNFLKTVQINVPLICKQLVLYISLKFSSFLLVLLIKNYLQ